MMEQRTLEYVCVFVRAAADRLRAAERLVLALPQLLGDSLDEIDLRYQSDASLLGIFVRLRADGLAEERSARLVFWTARAGGRAMATASMSGEDRSRIGAYLAQPTKALSAIPAPEIFETSGPFFTELGARADRRRSLNERPQLVLDLGGPGGQGVRWSPEDRQLFVAAPLAPPQGDELPLLLRVPGSRSVEGRATVVEVREKFAAGPGSPAGFTLRLEEPSTALLQALARGAGAAPAPVPDARAAPRVPVTAPVKVSPPGGAAAQARIEYATEGELAADFVENLSHGGAFVRTSSPAPVGSAVELELRLPNGTDLRTRAAVVYVNEGGMGVHFELDAEAEAVLDSAMAHVSGRRRALVVDDDALVLRMLSDALRERGFEVLTASNAADGLERLSEELLSLDVLLTDVVMPGMSGEDFVRLIRRTGGETELAIVCVTGQHGEGFEARLESAGADAVLDKALGPALIAQAAEAVVERKRMAVEESFDSAPPSGGATLRTSGRKANS